MDKIIRPTDLRDHYRNFLEKPLDHIKDFSQKVIASNIENKATGTGTHKSKVKPPTVAQLKDMPNDLTRPLLNLAKMGIWISPNKDSKIGEAMLESSNISTLAASNLTNYTCDYFRGVNIPLLPGHHLWGHDYDPISGIKDLLYNDLPRSSRVKDLKSLNCILNGNTIHHPLCSNKNIHKSVHMPLVEALKNTKNTRSCYGNNPCSHCTPDWKPINDHLLQLSHVSICTDGSTFTGLPSGAGLVYMSDNIRENDLWKVQGDWWKISEEDNFVAELAAIHKAIRAPPVNINATIFSDSLSCIQSIQLCLASGPRFNPLRKAGRPYILTIKRALQAREKAGATTNFTHVRSHTGKRDAASVGNAAADYTARFAALNPNKEGSCHMNLMEHELRFVLMTNKGKGEKSEPSPVHGDIRRAIKTHLALRNDQTWADRNTRGALVRSFPAQVANIIKSIWKTENQLSSDSVVMALTGLTMASRKHTSPTGNFERELCSRCGTGAHLTALHLLHSCPRNASALNERDKTIADILCIPENTVDHSKLDLLDKYSIQATNIVTEILHSLPFGPNKDTARSLNFTHDQFGDALSSPDIDGDGSHPSIMVPITKLNIRRLLSVQGARSWDGSNYMADSVSKDIWENTASAVWDTVSDLHTGVKRWHALEWRTACRDSLRTYSDLHFNPLISPNPWGASWCTHNPNFSSLGGTWSPSQVPSLYTCE